MSLTRKQERLPLVSMTLWTDKYRISKLWIEKILTTKALPAIGEGGKAPGLLAVCSRIFDKLVN